MSCSDLECWMDQTQTLKEYLHRAQQQAKGNVVYCPDWEITDDVLDTLPLRRIQP